MKRRRKSQRLQFIERRLTPKHRVILDRICRGYTQKEIAVELHCSCRTIEAELRAIRGRLAARTTGQAAAILGAEQALLLGENPYVISALADRP